MTLFMFLLLLIITKVLMCVRVHLMRNMESFAFVACQLFCGISFQHAQGVKQNIKRIYQIQTNDLIIVIFDWAWKRIETEVFIYDWLELQRQYWYSCNSGICVSQHFSAKSIGINRSCTLGYVRAFQICSEPQNIEAFQSFDFLEK